MKTTLAAITALALAACSTSVVEDADGNRTTTKQFDRAAGELAREGLAAYLAREDRERNHDLELARIRNEK